MSNTTEKMGLGHIRIANHLTSSSFRNAAAESAARPETPEKERSPSFFSSECLFEMGRLGDDSDDDDVEEYDGDVVDGPWLSRILLIPCRDPSRLCKIIAGDFNSRPFVPEVSPSVFIFSSFRVRETRTALDNDTSEEDTNDCDVLWLENESLRWRLMSLLRSGEMSELPLT
jgi:hypothetical protein